MIPRQYRIHVVLMISALLMIVIPLLSETPDREQAAQATAAAERFLEMVDQDRYEESWQMAAKLLQEQVPLDEWKANLGQIRTAVGPLIEREQSDVSYATMAKDSPEGDYIQIFYDSRFGARSEVEEIVTTMLEQDGHWRVAGYFVR